MSKAIKYLGCIFAIIALSLESVVAQNDDEAHPDCPVQGVVYLPHEDCTKYYVCDNGIRIEQDCAYPLYFNPEIEQCDYPANVPDCVGGTRPPTGTTTVAPPTNATTQAPPTNATTQAPPTNATTLAPPTNATTLAPPTNATTLAPPTNATTLAPPTNATTLAPPTNATTLAPPTNATTLAPPTNATTLAPPTNATTQAPPTNATTQAPPTNSTTPTPPSNGTTPLPNGCPPEGVDKIPHPSSCSLYIICANGVAYDEKCADGLHFNPIAKECDFPENVNCTEPTEAPTTPTTTQTPLPECPPEGVSFHPYPGNCSLYILCVDGFPLIQMCVAGTCFDPEELQCQANDDNTTFAISKPVQVDSEYIFDTASRCEEEKYQGFVLVPSTKSCNQYSVCHEGSYKGTLECQDGFNFDYMSQTCISQSINTCLL